MANKSTLLSILNSKREYTNQNDVTVVFIDKETIDIYCVYPGFDNAKEYISLELCGRHKTYATFASCFLIESIQDFERITPRLIFEHYERDKGNTEVFCMIDHLHFGGSLHFRKNENGFFARDDATGQYHNVGRFISEPDDFIEYTCNYFLLHANCTARIVDDRKN